MVYRRRNIGQNYSDRDGEYRWDSDNKEYVRVTDRDDDSWDGVYHFLNYEDETSIGDDRHRTLLHTVSSNDSSKLIEKYSQL